MSVSPSNSQPSLARAGIAGLGITIGLAALKLALHLLTATNYGLFVDELYFLACGQHLAWGYVDMPPLTAVQAWLARALFHQSVFGIHLFPALAGAGLVLLTGALVHELGGKRFATAAACLGVVVAPVYLMTDSYLSMNSIEPLVWMGCAYVLIRMIKSADPRGWLAFGLLGGIGLLNKDTMLLFGFALVSGLLLTPARKLMWNRWFLAGGALALVIFLPNLIWMIQHHFPHLEQLANIRRNQRNVQLDPLGFLLEQVLFQQPFTLPLWLGGLVYFMAHPQGKVFRSLGWAYLISLGILLATAGRVYYLSPSYPMLLAGGAVWMEGWLSRPRRTWVKAAYLSLVTVSGVLMVPFALPVLPPQTYVAYSRATHFDQVRIENHALGALPQLFADRFGWPEMAEATAEVYNSLSPEEQSRTVIFTGGYPQAGAIDFYGPDLGLPKAMSGHLTYFYWGEETARDVAPGATVIALAVRVSDLRPYFESVEVAGYVRHPYAMPYENFPIYLCRGLKVPLIELWPQLKNWN
jgi:hypothetical protein